MSRAVGFIPSVPVLVSHLLRPSFPIGRWLFLATVAAAPSGSAAHPQAAFAQEGEAREVKVLPNRAPDGRWTVDAWAPTEGLVLNGGIRLKFGAEAH